MTSRINVLPANHAVLITTVDDHADGRVVSSHVIMLVGDAELSFYCTITRTVSIVDLDDGNPLIEDEKARRYEQRR